MSEIKTNISDMTFNDKNPSGGNGGRNLRKKKQQQLSHMVFIKETSKSKIGRKIK